MKHLALSLTLMLVLVPVSIATHGHNLWAGAAYGVWGSLVALTARWALT